MTIKHDTEILTITLPRWRAKELGMLVCGSCGWPENNHFDHGDRKCAHVKCAGWVESTIKHVDLLNLNPN